MHVQRRAHIPWEGWARFVQFLLTPHWEAIFCTIQLTANLQILKHLIGWKRVAEQLLYLMWVVSEIRLAYEARISAKARIRGQRV